MRKREKLFISKSIDLPFKSQNEELCYDSIRQYFHNGFIRGEVQIKKPTSYRAGLSSQDSQIITHSVRILKLEHYETGDYVFWMDGIVPRRLRIVTVMQDQKSRKHVILYCTEKEYDQSLAANENISTYGNPVTNPFEL